jgi:hypothetical protein
MQNVSGTAQTRHHSRELEARRERLIRLKSPMAQRERAGTFVGIAIAQESHKEQLQQRLRLHRTSHLTLRKL